MAITTTIGPFLDAYRANLILRSGLSGVNVFTGMVVQENAGAESIMFGEVVPTADWGLIGNRRIHEAYTITGHIWTEKTGADEATISAARTRSEAILNELIEELRTNGSQGLAAVRNNSHISSWAEKSGISANNNRVCEITFTVTVEADLTA